MRSSNGDLRFQMQSLKIGWSKVQHSSIKISSNGIETGSAQCSIKKLREPPGYAVPRQHPFAPVLVRGWACG